jgi:plasmid maintenance system antidote protein VapI
VPAKDAHKLLLDKLKTKPKPQGTRRPQPDIPAVTEVVDQAPLDRPGEDETALNLVLQQMGLTREQWRSDVIRYALVGNRHLTEAAAELELSKSQLSNIIAGRRSMPERVALRFDEATTAPLGHNDLWKSEMERTQEDLSPLSDELWALLNSDTINAQISQIECERMILNPLPFVPREPAQSTAEVLDRYGKGSPADWRNLSREDWESLFDDLQKNIAPTDDDDDVDLDDIE